MTLREETARQVDGLRRAAAHLGGRRNGLTELALPVPVVRTGPALLVMRLPGTIARPMARQLQLAADEIERHGHALGLVVSNELEIAGAILGQDLGHNR